MSLGIDHSKKVVDEISTLICDVIKLIQHGISLGSISELLKVVSDLRELVVDAPEALPELKDLDPSEVGVLGSMAYESVLKIIEQVKAA